MAFTIEPSVKTYLAAVGASAIYISVDGFMPVSVGCARSLDQVIKNLRERTARPVSFGWVAWAQQYDALLKIATTPGLMLAKRDDGVRINKTLPEIILVIARLAKQHEIVLTPHDKVVARASELAAYVDQTLKQLHDNGELKQFNRAYKNFRLEKKSKGEKDAPPYWAVIQRLRRVTIKALLLEPNHQFSQKLLTELILQEFPWVREKGLDRKMQYA